MANVATAEILLQLNTSQYDQQFQRTKAQLSGLSAKEYGVNINNRDADLALQTTIGLVRGLTNSLKGIGRSAIGEAQAFQGALNSLQAISGATAEELTGLREQAIAVGAATTQTPTQVLRAAESFSRLGFTINEASDAAPGLVALAESTGSSLESASGVAAKALNIYKGSLDALQASNILTATVNNTAVESIDEFNQAISKAGGIAKNNNISFAQLAATFGVFQGTGSSPEVAATALKNVITNLAVPTTEKAAAGIASLGLKTRDATGNFRGLDVVLIDLINSLGQLDPATRDRTILDIFGRDSLAVVSGLVASGAEKVAGKLNLISEAANDAGFAAQSAATRLQGAGAALNALEGSVDTAKIAIGETLLPVVELGAKAAASFINIFAEAPPVLQKTATIAGATAVSLGSLVVALSAIRSAQASETLQRIGLSAGALKETLSVVGTQVGNTSKSILGFTQQFSGDIKIPRPKFPDKGLTPDQAQAALLGANAQKSAALQIEAIRKFYEEKAKAALQSAVLAEQEQRANLALLKSQAGVKASTLATAEAKTRQAISSRIAAQANFEEATASRAAATADVQEATATQASAAADLKKATTTKAEAIATAFSTVKQKILTTATTAGTFAKEVYAVATGKVAAAEASAAVATAAAAAQFALLAGAVLVAAENLKILGLAGNDSKKKLNELKQGLKELGIESEKTQEKEEAANKSLGAEALGISSTGRFVSAIGTFGLSEIFGQEQRDEIQQTFDEATEGLGFLDKQRVKFDQTLAGLSGKNKTLEESINSVTSAAIKEAQARDASIKASELSAEATSQETSQILAKRKAIEEAITAGTLDAATRTSQALELEKQLDQKEKEIDLYKQSGLAVESQVQVLEAQANKIRESITLLKGGTVVTEEQIISTQILTKSTKELAASYDQTNSELDIALAKTKALVAEQQLSGEITESEGLANIAVEEQRILRERLAANEQFLADLKAQQTEAGDAITPEGAAELQKEITAAEKEQYDLRLNLAKSQISEQKRISDEALKSVLDNAETRKDELVATEQETRNAILAEQLAGVIDVQTAQNLIRDAELASLEQRVTDAKAKRDELEAAQGIDPEKQAAQVKEANAEILKAEGDLLQKRLSIKQDAAQQELKAIADAQKKAQTALAQGLKEDELELKKSLASQAITRDEYEEQSIQLQTKGTEERIALLERERDEVNRFASEGRLTQEEAQERLADIASRTTTEQIKLVDQQISQQKKLAEETQRRAQIALESEKVITDLKIQGLEAEKQALEFQQQLGSAQLGLLDAQTQLQLQRLGFAKEDAVNQQQAFTLSKEIFATEKAATLTKLDAEKASLDLKIAQQKIDNEIAKSRAEIGIAEAQAAIAQAKARDASAEELANLQKVLDLKQGILGQTESTVSRQSKLFQIQKDTLAAQQEATLEGLARQEQQLGLTGLGLDPLTDKQRAELAREETEASKLISGLQTTRFADGGAQAEAIAQTALSNVGNEALFRDLSRAGGFAGEIASLVQELSGAGIGEKQLTRLGRDIEGDTSADVVNLLQQLVDAVKEGDRPNISVSTATPLADTLAILRG